MIRFLRFLTAISCGNLVAAEFPEPYDSERGNPSPMPPLEALKALQLPPNFKATLFAAEPDVRNPIAMTWDGKGRMWVAENYTYAESSKRFDLALRDRVIILEDKDWDGVAETRKVFTDDVRMLTSVETGRGGVWLMCPPRLLFIPDANGDDLPDAAPQVVVDGFTVAEGAYHNFANGLRFARDGWLYGRCGHSCPGLLGVPGTPDDQRIPIKGGIWRFHPEKKIVEVITHGTTNPWGHDWDQNGEMFFVNTVTGHLWHLIHGAHLIDRSGQSNPLIYEPLDTIADHYHYNRRESWMKSRDGKANDFGGGHSHAGAMIYQADQWPAEYHNRLFTLNLHGRRTNVERLERHGSGYIGRHEPDIFLSGDSWFRGIEISAGPDGSGFILDWSDTGECHDHSGVHRNSGRIFRVSYGDPVRPVKPFAWRKPWPKADLNSPDEHARALAIREFVQFSPIDTLTGPLPHAVYPKLPFDPAALARNEKSALVRLTLASVLQRLPLAERPALAAALLSHAADANDPFLPHLVWYGISPLAKPEPAALVALVNHGAWPKVTRWISRSLATHPESLELLLAVDHPSPIGSVLEGMSDAFKGIRKAPQPANWNDFVARAKSNAPPREIEQRHATIRDLSVLFGDGRALEEVRRVALDPDRPLPARLTALDSLIQAQPSNLRGVCETLLETPGLASTAVRGLARFDDPAIGEKLAKTYLKFAPQDRGAVIDALVTRPTFAQAMLDHLRAGGIPRSAITAFHARQIRGFNQENLTKQLAEVWGELRDSPADKRQFIDKLKTALTPEVLASADPGRGRAHFTMLCASCHVMHGAGGVIGPDLTGGGRANPDYLLENIVDPGAVVSADYRMSVVTLNDGRVLGGVISAQNESTVTLTLQAGPLTLERAGIAKIATSPVSMMPEGLLESLPPEQVRDLIAYLMHPAQVE